MPRKYNSKQKEYLLSPDRAKTLDTHRVMSFLPLMVYQDVADVGSGPGYFSIPLAKFLFDGQVLALDIHKQMLEAVQNEADKLKLSNITTIHSTEDKLALNKDSGSLSIPVSFASESNFFKIAKACPPKPKVQST